MKPISLRRSMTRRATRHHCRLALVLVATACSCATPNTSELVGVSTVTGAAIGREPLASWVDGNAKRAVIDFVMRVSSPGSAAMVPQQERIATFDDNGTLWPEKPIPEAAFAGARLRAQALEKAKLRSNDSYGALVKNGIEGLGAMGMDQVLSTIAVTHAGMTDEAFESDARSFLFNARHARFNAPYPSLAYKPMRELLVYLRDHGFTIYLCTEEDEGFARAFAPETYDIPRERIIGSTFQKAIHFEKGRSVLQHEPAVESFNDREAKVLNIARRIGRRPLIAVGNVGSGGDIPMLTYARGNTTPSLELVIQHDDPVRELAYAEPDGATLAAAREHGFVVVSMKSDWAQIFEPASPTKKKRD